MTIRGKRRVRRRKAAKPGVPGATGIRLALGLAQLAAQGMTALVATAKPPRSAKPAEKRANSKTRVPGVVGCPRSSFSAGTHSCPQGSLRYRIFKPGAAAGSKPMPLLIMLHGCAQTPEDFATGTGMNALAKERGVIVVYPGQSSKAHSNRCWNWFDPAHTARGLGEAAAIASLTRRVLDTHGADPARVYVAGLSAGASMALVLAHAYPDLFAAVGVHSGLPLGAARDQVSAIMAMQRGNPGVRLDRAVPTIVFHGSHDRVVHPRNGRLVAIRAREPYIALRHAQSAGRAAGGHAYAKSVDRINAGRPLVEHWTIRGAGHAWSGGSPRGRFTDPKGPDASREMLRFLLRHSLAARTRKALASALARQAALSSLRSG
ncbi:PHB depolymerase family esterase [Paracoccus yeei]